MFKWLILIETAANTRLHGWSYRCYRVKQLLRGINNIYCDKYLLTSTLTTYSKCKINTQQLNKELSSLGKKVAEKLDQQKDGDGPSLC